MTNKNIMTKTITIMMTNTKKINGTKGKHPKKEEYYRLMILNTFIT